MWAIIGLRQGAGDEAGRFSDHPEGVRFLRVRQRLPLCGGGGAGGGVDHPWRGTYRDFTAISMAIIF